MNIYEFTSLESQFTFGRYKGLTLADVMEINSEYLMWCVTSIEGFLLHDEALEQIRIVYPNFYVSAAFETSRLENLNQYYNEENDDYEPNWYPEEESTYDRYSGSYAQDEAGYSDDDIDTIFDGDPSAYWNVD